MTSASARSEPLQGRIIQSIWEQPEQCECCTPYTYYTWTWEPCWAVWDRCNNPQTPEHLEGVLYVVRSILCASEMGSLQWTYSTITVYPVQSVQMTVVQFTSVDVFCARCSNRACILCKAAIKGHCVQVRAFEDGGHSVQQRVYVWERERDTCVYIYRYAYIYVYVYICTCYIHIR